MVDADPQWLRAGILVLLGVVTYFLKRSLHRQDSMEKQIHSLETRIAVLLDRDRRRRLADYQFEAEHESDPPD